MTVQMLIVLLSMLGIASTKRTFYIGGMFSDQNTESEIAFQSAIEHENRFHNKDFDFAPIVRIVDPLDTFQAEKIACELASEGVIAIFGPSSTYTSNIVASVCHELGIPHIIVHWMPEELGPNTEHHNHTRNFFPDPSLFAAILKNIIVDYDWKEFSIIYENNDSLERLQDVLQIHEPNDKPVSVWQLEPDQDLQPMLKAISRSGERNVILDCSPANIMSILTYAVDMNMLAEYQNYIITSLDAHTLNFANLRSNLANITTLRLMTPTSYYVNGTLNEWLWEEKARKTSYRTDGNKIKTESALFYDAVQTFGLALRQFSGSQIKPIRHSKCMPENKWEQGMQIIEEMDLISTEGMTGPIEFSYTGHRNNTYLEILEMHVDGFVKIATWNASHGVVTTRSPGEVDDQIILAIQNKTFIVAARLGAPYLTYKEKIEGVTYEGNDQFKGYSIDLIDEISKIVKFKYKMVLVPDNKHGSYNKKTKTWDGLVKYLLDRKADMAICDLTITYERRTAVDFTSPFMTLGISILYAKPNKEPPGLFSFMSPLSLDVWLTMATAYLCVSVLLFFLAKMATDDWENPHPCDDNPEELETIWNMPNCIWLTAGSIMQQGCDLLPKAVSTRLAAGLWWFFALIVISSYTANLAAFLTNERMDESISSAEDLAKQSKIKYGVMSGGSTLSFFKESNFSTYQRMWAAMESADPSVFVKNNDEGIDRVVKGNKMYAFLMESTLLEYTVNRNCNLTKVGTWLDSKGHGIALPANSPYRTYISQAVLKLQEEGKLLELKNKWWDDKNTVCQDSGAGGDTLELGMGNVGGVFLVLLCGCGAAFVVGVLEFLWNVRDVAIQAKTTPWNAFKKELLFALDVRITKKPVVKSDESATHKSSSSVRSSFDLNDGGSFRHLNNV